MESARAIVLIALLSFLLLACSTESRKDPAGEYWRNIMKDQPMLETINGMIPRNSDSAPSSTRTNKKTDCHKNIDDLVSTFTNDFEPTPNVSAYSDDKIDASAFTDDFEPTPNVSAYADEKTNSYSTTGDVSAKEINQQFSEEFDPTPNVSNYNV